MQGISIKPTIGVGDAIQYSSLPENYFTATGEKLFDISRPWFFDYNPYVERDLKGEKLTKVTEMWNFSPRQYDWPVPQRSQAVYNSNAEIWSLVLGVETTLNRPRLYRYENFPFEERELILLHLDGRSHGMMPKHVIEHILGKYLPTGRLAQIGTNLENIGIPELLHINTPTLWDLAEVVSKARMLICVDSGPSWVAACYPDVIIKKLRTKPSPETFKTWTPLAVNNIHSHWDDRCHQIFNPTEQDIGFTSSYRKI